MTELTCKVCGSLFFRRNNSSCYCSNDHFTACKICNKKISYKKNKKPNCCSESCTKKYRALKTEEAIMKKYGVKNISQLEHIKEKKKKTCLKNYGVEHPAQCKEIKQKQDDTLKKKYSVTNAYQIPEVQEKSQKTSLERYGATCSFASKKGQKKIKQTNLKRYGVENPYQIPEVQGKVKKTNIERYGIENPFQSYEWQIENQKNIQKKFGVSGTTHIRIENLEDWLNIENLVKNEKWTILDLADHFKLKPLTIRSKLRELGITDFIETFYKFSELELKVANQLNNLGLTMDKDYKPHYRRAINPLELDFYLPEYNLGIELSPSYTHSTERIEDSNYHLNKFCECKNKNIKLYTWFDHHNIKRLQNHIKDIILNNNYILDYNIVDSVNHSFLPYTKKYFKTLSFTKFIEIKQEEDILGYIGIKQMDKDLYLELLDYKYIENFINFDKLVKILNENFDYVYLYFNTYNSLTDGDFLSNHFNLIENKEPMLNTFSKYDFYDCGMKVWKYNVK